MVNLSIGNFNVKGLAGGKKRRETFHWIREKKKGIYIFFRKHIVQKNLYLIFKKTGVVTVYFVIRILQVQVL
jgi:hypothetical protein